MEHKLSNQALEDLICLINILLPTAHKFVRSGYLLKKYFVNLFHEPLPKRHKYCGRCLGSIPPAMNVCNNEQCNKVNASVKEFLEIDLFNQLRRLYKGKCCCNWYLKMKRTCMFLMWEPNYPTLCLWIHKLWPLSRTLDRANPQGRPELFIYQSTMNMQGC